MIPMKVFNKIILGHNPLHVKRHAYSSTSKVACLLTCSRMGFHDKNPACTLKPEKEKQFLPSIFIGPSISSHKLIKAYLKVEILIN
jgi:hypothetical protein